jgi:hypothetical protein
MSNPMHVSEPHTTNAYVTSEVRQTSYSKKTKSDTLGSLALPPLPTVAQPASASIASSSTPPPPSFFFFLPFGPSPAAHQTNKGSVCFKTEVTEVKDVTEVTEVCRPTSCKRAREAEKEREECVRCRSKPRRCFRAYSIPAYPLAPSLSLHSYASYLALHATALLVRSRLARQHLRAGAWQQPLPWKPASPHHHQPRRRAVAVAWQTLPLPQLLAWPQRQALAQAEVGAAAAWLLSSEAEAPRTLPAFDHPRSF